jgi:hypothetical protein
MRRVLKTYVIPHEGNNYTPHLLREAGAFGLFLIIIGLFGLSLTQVAILKGNNLAAVLSPVLVDLVNTDRGAQNLPPLKLNALLQEAAQEKANDMAAKGYFAHNSPDGTTPWHWFENVGYAFQYAGENLAVNFTESSDVERAWMNSSDHRSNILNTKFTEIGIATQNGFFNGQPAVFVVQEFGRPLSVAARISIAKNASTQKIASSSPLGAVKAAASTTASTEVSIPVPTPVPSSKNGTLLGQIIAQPRTLLRFAYGFLAALILFIIGMIILGEYRRHHIKTIGYGAGLLVVMLILVYVLSAIIPQVIVV